MKKYITYFGAIAIGIALGAFLFGGSNAPETEHSHAKAETQAQMWTCAMHPQIMQPEPGNCPICGMELIPAIAGDGGLASDQFRMSQNALALADVQTTIVGNQYAGESGVTLSGKITENEESNRVQVSYFSGRIETLYVNTTGTKVHKGQLLASIYSPDLLAAQQELITTAELKDSEPSLYKAVRNKLKLWKLTDAQIKQIETSKKVTETINVYATVSGTVLKKLVEQGDYVKEGQALFRISDLSSVWAIFDIYESQIDLFKKGQEMDIYTNIDPQTSYRARVAFIDPMLDDSSRTLKLRAVLRNSERLFKPGMFIEGHFNMNETFDNQTITIPSSAVLWTGEKSVVYVKVNPRKPIFEMREVELGNRTGAYLSVLHGLERGEQIVTHGAFSLDAAAQLKGKRSMMNKNKKQPGANPEQPGSAESKADPDTHRRVSVSPDFKRQLEKVFDSYIEIKDALVKDDPNSVQTHAQGLLKNLASVDMRLLPDENAHTHWMKVSKQINAQTVSISATKNIGEQRHHFKDLSHYLTQAIQMFGVGQPVYHQFCPMADENHGAYWLSNDHNVLNPYFGRAMLSCGSVKQIIEE